VANLKEPVLKRDLSLDFLKGTSVFFMVLTHVNAWYYTHAQAWLSFFTLWGASICYVTFVFAYGIGYGKQLVRKGALDVRSTLQRLGILLLGYYFIAVWLSTIWAGRILNLKEILEIIFFINLPSYTEFLPTFVFFGLILVVLQEPIRRIASRPALALLTGGLIYSLAMFLYQLDWGPGAGSIFKGLLVGYENLNRWGVLSYFPIFLWGIAWGHRFDPADQAGRTKTVLFALGTIAFFVLINSGFRSERWPPTIPYYLWGLSYSLGVLVLWPLIGRVRSAVKVGVFLGRNAFEFFIWHTIIIITSVALFIPYRTFNEWQTLLALAAVLAVNSVAAIRPKIALRR